MYFGRGADDNTKHRLSKGKERSMENKVQTGIKKQNTGIRCLSSNALKGIACISMLIDHTGIVFFDSNPVMRAVGRLAFPIFAFLIVQGLLHTSDVRRYMGRLLIFALLSEVPFDLAMYDCIWYPGAQNIFFTLALGLFVIYTFETIGPLRRWAAEIAFVSALAAEFLRFDYGMAGIGVILLFYWCVKERQAGGRTGEPESAEGVPEGFSPRLPDGEAVEKAYFGRRQNLEIVLLSSLAYILCLGMKQLYALLAMIPINMYNGKRGRLRLKYVFYLFYPMHLLLIWIIWKNLR